MSFVIFDSSLTSRACDCTIVLYYSFTKWASTRKPEDVFHLLEKIFGAFDSIALRRKVFKVETIGGEFVWNK